jgi:HNH endonuclease
MTNRYGDLLFRLEDKILIGDGCWEWAGSKDGKGYGQITIERRTRRAHRVVYELMAGPIPDGLTLDHLCRNPGCVRPAHLEAVTRGENVLRGDGITAVAARRSHCPYGHPFDEANTRMYRGQRCCRACAREAARRARARRAGCV